MGLALASIALGFLTSTTARPQEPKAQDAPQTLLSASELSGLNKKLREWIDARMKWDPMPDGRNRIKAGKKQNAARDKFDKEWGIKSKKEDLLKSVADLEAIYHNAFSYDTAPTMKGEISAQNTKTDGPKYDAWIPKTYDPDEAYRTVLLVPGYADGEKGSYALPRDYFANTWKDSELLTDTLFVVPPIDEAVDLDGEVDFSRPGEEDKDIKRREALLRPAGIAQRQLHFDRTRFVMDCGRGSSRFGLRLATYFPSRFAGVILRYPEEVEDLRYGSLCGLPVLLVKSPGNAEFVDSLAKQLNELHEGACTVMDAKGSLPFPELRDAISTWTKDLKRDLYRDRVVLAPNHDLFHRSYWVEMGTVEPLASVAREDQPYLEAKVDRTANKIDIVAKSVSNFILLLNDRIVDLEQEVTVVVNGVAQKRMPVRQKALLYKLIWDRYDPTQLFTFEWRMSVPDPR